jgi:hypothetical protein
MLPEVGEAGQAKLKAKVLLIALEVWVALSYNI